MSDTIILNRICTGDYLDEGANLGHEVVNLFKADNGKYYVYLMPDGTYIESREKDKVRVIYQAYELMLKLNPNSVEDLLTAHRLMMQGLVSENGRFRSGGVGVFDGDKLIHMAPPAQFVPQQI